MIKLDLYNKIFGTTEVQSLLIDIVIAAVIFLVFKIAAVLLFKNSHLILTKIFRTKTEKAENVVTASFFKPISLFLQITGILIAIRYIPFSPNIWITLWPMMIRIYRICAILIISFALVSLVGNAFIFSEKLTTSENKTIFNFVTKISKGIIIALAAAAILKELNFDVSGLVAGLGISGVVLALAAQDAASNFFSGVVILFDKPFSIGDWISVGGMEGIVEEMNFRSCRIRTFDNALISVPNSKLSNDSVTNWQKMELRKAKIIFGLTYSTKKETLKNICDEIKANLLLEKNIKKETIIVWFDKFNASSLDIVVQYHSYLTSFSDFMLLKEKVQYMIMDVVEKYNSDFAFDTKTIYIENSTDSSYIKNNTDSTIK